MEIFDGGLLPLTYSEKQAQDPESCCFLINANTNRTEVNWCELSPHKRKTCSHPQSGLVFGDMARGSGMMAARPQLRNVWKGIKR